MIQVSISVFVSWESISRHHDTAWRSALKWVCLTLVSRVIQPRTLILTVKLWGHLNAPCSCGATVGFLNHLGGVPACPAAQIQSWPLPTRNMRPSLTATMVGLCMALSFLKCLYFITLGQHHLKTFWSTLNRISR